MDSHHPQCRTVIIIDKDLNANSLSKHLNKKLVEEYDGDFPQLKPYEGSGASSSSESGGLPTLQKFLINTKTEAILEEIDKIRVVNRERRKTACILHTVTYLIALLLLLLVQARYMSHAANELPPYWLNLINQSDDSSTEISWNPPLPLVSPPTEFPSVTICSNNFLMKTATNEIMELVIDSLYNEESYERMAKEELQSAGEIDSWGWYCFYVMSQHRLKSMLVKCTFGSEPCSVQDFTPTLTNHGLCYIFNAWEDQRKVLEENIGKCVSPDNKPANKTTAPSRRKAEKLELWLTAQQEEYLYLEETSAVAGFTVTIDPKRDGLGVINRDMVHQAGLGKNNIYFSKQQDAVSVTDVNTSCHQECIKRKQVSICNCVHYYDWLSSDPTPICEPKAIRRCLDPVKLRHGEECEKECLTTHNISYSTRRESFPLSIAVLKSLGDYWPYVNYGDTPANESTNWKLAMGLPLEPYYYWKENLVIINVEAEKQRHSTAKGWNGLSSRQHEANKESNHITSHSVSRLCHLSAILSVVVFSTGFTLHKALILVTSSVRVLIRAHSNVQNLT